LWNGTAWTNGLLTTTTAVVRAKSNLVTDQSSNIYYIATDNQVHYIHYTFNWFDDVLNSAAVQARTNSALVADAVNKVYYEGTDNKIHGFYYDVSTGWHDFLLDANSTNIATNTHFTYNNDNIIYLGTDNLVNVTFAAGCKWLSKKLTAYGTTSNLNFSSWATRYYSSVYGNTFYLDNLGKLHKLVPGLDYTSGFVYVKDKKLMLGSSPYYVKGVNYSASLNQDTHNGSPTYGTYFCGRYLGYCGQFLRCSDNPTTSLGQVDADFQELQYRGCNTIRLVGMSAFVNKNDINDQYVYATVWRDENVGSGYSSTCEGSFSWDVTNTPDQRLDDNFIDNVYIPMLDQVLTKAAAHGLRVILLSGFNGGYRPNVYPRYEVFLGKIASYFKNNSTLMGFDLYNEPENESYLGTFTKSDVCSKTNDMYQAIRNTGSKALVTLGTATHTIDPWDPKIMSVDFLSYHEYVCWGDCGIPADFNVRMDNMKSDMIYSAAITDRPWIIGETGFQAFSTSYVGGEDGTLAQQDSYMQNSLDYAWDEGASGNLWWEYHDTYNGGNNSYFGLYGNTNNCLAPNTDFMKNAATVMQNFSFPCSAVPLTPPSTYFNYNNNYGYTYSGTLKDANGLLPIKNSGYIQCWSTGYAEWLGFTYTDNNGNFTLKTNSAASIFSYTAPGYDSYTTWSGFQSTVNLSKNTCTPYTFRLAQNQTDSTLQNDLDVQVYPNPFNTNITVIVNEMQQSQIEIYNLMGEVLYQSQIENPKTEIDLSSFSSGIYFMRVNDGKRIVTKKIIKQ
jgi:hypothetical protein